MPLSPEEDRRLQAITKHLAGDTQFARRMGRTSMPFWQRKGVKPVAAVVAVAAALSLPVRSLLAYGAYPDGEVPALARVTPRTTEDVLLAQQAAVRIVLENTGYRAILGLCDEELRNEIAARNQDRLRSPSVPEYVEALQRPGSAEVPCASLIGGGVVNLVVDNIPVHVRAADVLPASGGLPPTPTAS